MRKKLPVLLFAVTSLLAQTFVCFGATGRSPTSVAELLQNIKMAGDECLLLDSATFSAEGMLQLFGAHDAQFFNHEGQVANSKDYLTSVQVRASDFAGIVPKLPIGAPSLQVVGQSGSHSGYLRFLLSDLSGVNLGLRDAEDAVGRKLSYVRLPPPMPMFEGIPPDPSYYLLEHTTKHCQYRLQIHFRNNRLDEIYLKEDKL